MKKIHDTTRASYNPDEHDKGEWTRDQISDDEWNDYEWVETEGSGEPATYLRGAPRR